MTIAGFLVLAGNAIPAGIAFKISQVHCITLIKGIPQIRDVMPVHVQDFSRYVISEIILCYKGIPDFGNRIASI